MQMKTLLIFSPLKSNYFVNKTKQNFQMAPFTCHSNIIVKNNKKTKKVNKIIIFFFNALMFSSFDMHFIYFSPDVPEMCNLALLKELISK